MPELNDEQIEKIGKGELELGDALGVDAEQTAALLLAGHQLFEQGRLNDARDIFVGLALLDRNNPYVHGILGAIYQKMENYDVALSFYNMALNLHPEDLISLTNRGEVFLKLGKFKEAAADLKKAIELDLDQNHPAGNRARLLITMTREALELAKNEGFQAVLKAKEQLKRQTGSAKG